MTHPLSDFEIQGRNFKCFGPEGSGYFYFSPISIVIGKNNVGKSAVVDLLNACLGKEAPISQAPQRRTMELVEVDLKVELSEGQLKSVFGESSFGGGIPGANHWEFGKRYLGNKILLGFVEGNSERKFIDLSDKRNKIKLKDNIKNILVRVPIWPFRYKNLVHIAAERRVSPERSSSPLPLPDGQGITNLVRYFINSDSQPRSVVEVDLLSDLNSIYAGDCAFNSIICQENDETNNWEIFLREDDKGEVRLSESGSSLQSIFIFLAYLRLIPLLNNQDWTTQILAIEEPENNLHPALLRRLLNFLARMRNELGFSLVLTSHSPICIDWASRRSDAGIIHVERKGNNSECRNVLEYGDKTNILDDLDVRGSDILQSNGIIWVEGPSDRIYIKCWIDLFSEGKIKEGTHYSFMYYGGRILSHFEALPERSESNLISLVSLNRNVAVVMDSDRKLTKGIKKTPPRRLNATKLRLLKEVDKCGGFSWITAGKEIENYTPKQVWKNLAGEEIKIENEFVDIPNIRLVKSFRPTKVDLAHEVTQVLKLDDLKNHLDLQPKINELTSHIKKWNSIR